jgi:type IV fimbrial biogenesis protein FimT
VHAVSGERRSTQGFTLVEIMIALAILSIMLAVGVPSMRSWMSANSAASAVEFYAEGFRMARAEAVKRTAVTRLVVTQNATNNQYDWQIDLCMPTSAVPCDDTNGTWSTAKLTNGDAHAADFKSIARSAQSLPGSKVLTLTLSPKNASAVYFTPLGWVNGTIGNSLTRIGLTPVVADAFPTSAVVVTLAGVVTKCNPNVAQSDSRSCPP